MSSVAAEDSENWTSSVCKESGPEPLKNQDICESSSSGSEPAGLNHCGEHQDFAHCVGTPETTGLKDAIKRLVGSEHDIKNKALVYINCLLLLTTTRGRIDITSLL